MYMYAYVFIHSTCIYLLHHLRSKSIVNWLDIDFVKCADGLAYLGREVQRFPQAGGTPCPKDLKAKMNMSNRRDSILLAS